ncbi:hypothetical protein GPZ77_34115 [Streptomyces sp. QHH-9511]|uniref:hypothetical protein n=1 Tax=Streptomyces sp. QHH-9511 TaxID=2684468 RepID=UPI0013164DD0|nr:hypothetical protein GPZ77_34115 [Streptomyces sp. QHH-9511]
MRTQASSAACPNGYAGAVEKPIDETTDGPASLAAADRLLKQHALVLRASAPTSPPPACSPTTSTSNTSSTSTVAPGAGGIHVAGSWSAF